VGLGWGLWWEVGVADPSELAKEQAEWGWGGGLWWEVGVADPSELAISVVSVADPSEALTTCSSLPSAVLSL